MVLRRRSPRSPNHCTKILVDTTKLFVVASPYDPAPAPNAGRAGNLALAVGARAQHGARGPGTHGAAPPYGLHDCAQAAPDHDGEELGPPGGNRPRPLYTPPAPGQPTAPPPRPQPPDPAIR